MTEKTRTTTEPSGAKRRLRNKLRSRRGESLAETLCALLVLAMGLLMLAGAITTAANINASLEAREGGDASQEQRFLPRMDAQGDASDASLTYAGASETVRLYNEDGEGIYYYYTYPAQ